MSAPGAAYAEAAYGADSKNFSRQKTIKEAKPLILELEGHHPA
jgi:hypothetical protein